MQYKLGFRTGTESAPEDAPQTAPEKFTNGNPSYFFRSTHSGLPFALVKVFSGHICVGFSVHTCAGFSGTPFLHTCDYRSYSILCKLLHKRYPLSQPVAATTVATSNRSSSHGRSNSGSISADSNRKIYSSSRSNRTTPRLRTQ